MVLMFKVIQWLKKLFKITKTGFTTALGAVYPCVQGSGFLFGAKTKDRFCL